MKRTIKSFRAISLAALLLVLATSTAPAGIAQSVRAQAPELAPACDLPVCAGLVVSREGQPGAAQAAAPLTRTAASGSNPWLVDTGTPSPDGKWVAYTSIGDETGGPVFLQGVETGEWLNLIEQINARLADPQRQLPLDYGWDVIGWTADGARLAIGPVDLSLVVVVDAATFEARFLPFPGMGRGGRMFVDFAPDGSRFLFIGEDSAGEQVMGEMDAATGALSERLRVPYAQGVLSNPRYSPDQSSVAYLAQTGQPDSGLEYAIYLMSAQTGETRLLAGEGLTMTVPRWSPDGQKIAYVRREGAAPVQALAPEDERTNVWVVAVADGTETQATFADGFVRSPTWAADSHTLAYVMGDGQVGLADLAQPGETWLAGGASAHPELTSVFFLP